MNVLVTGRRWIQGGLVCWMDFFNTASWFERKIMRCHRNQHTQLGERIAQRLTRVLADLQKWCTIDAPK